MQLQRFLACLALVFLLVIGVARAQYQDAVWIHGGNQAVVLRLAFSPDSKYLASTIGDASVRIWDISNGALVRVVANISALSVSYNPHGDTVAVGGIDGTVRIIDVKTGQIVRSITAHSGKVNSVSYSKDGRYLATGGDDNLVKTWKTSDGSLVRTYTGHTGPINQVDYSDDGTMIASASDDHTAYLWNTGTGDTVRTFRGFTFVVIGVDLSDDGKRMIVPENNFCPGNAPGCGVRIYNTEDGSLIKTYNPQWLDTRAVAYGPGGDWAASCGRDGRVFLYQPKSPTAQPQLVLRYGTGAGIGVNTVAFSPDGNYLAMGGDDKSIRLRKMSPADTSTLIDASSNIRSLAITSTEVIAGDNEGKISGWLTTLGTQQFRKRGHYAPAQGLAQTNANEFVSAGIDNRLKLWGLPSGALLDSFPRTGALQAPFNAVAKVASTLIVTGQSSPETLVKMWDVTSRDSVGSYAGNTASVLGVAVSPDAKYIASAGADNIVRVWDRNTYQIFKTFTDHTSPVNAVEFSPDGKYIASVSDDRSVRVYTFPAGAPAGIYTGHSEKVTDLAFTDDSQYLVTSSADRTLKVWKISTGDNVYTYAEYPYEQTCVAVKGNYVASGASDGMVILWNLKTSGGSALSAPQLQMPSNNYTDQQLKTTVVWHPTPGATSYTLMVSTSDVFATGIILDESGLTDTTKSLGTLTPTTKYYWRVKASSGAGDSPWSEVWSFTTNTGGPSTPMQLGPPHKSIEQPVNATIWWTSAPGANYYRVELSNVDSATKADGTYQYRLKNDNPVDTFLVYNNLNINTTYYWHLRAVNSTAPSNWSPSWTFKTVNPGSVDGGVSLNGYALADARPNPANGIVAINFEMAKRTAARLSMVDEQGVTVATLVDGTLDAGDHIAMFDTSTLPSGVYFTRLETGSVVLMRKVVVRK